MLNILFSKYSDNLVDVNEYFDHSYEDWWFEDSFVKDIIEGVDNSGIDGLCVKSPVLGTLPVTKLSEGV